MKNTSLNKLPLWRLYACGAIVALLTACASSAPPNAEMAVGNAAVERATGPAAAEAPVALGFGEFQSLKDELQRDRGDGLPVLERAEMEAAFLQTLEIEAEAGGVPVENLDLVSGLVEEAEEVS